MSKTVPALRFPEFTEPWQTKKLGDIGAVIGGGTPDTQEEKFWGGDIVWLTPTEIKKKYISTSKRQITEFGLKKSSAKILPIGTVIFTSRATVGDVAIAESPFTTNQGFQSIVVNDDNYNEFIYYWISKNKKEFLKKAIGSTYPEITNTEMKKIYVNVPSLNEQKKIANFLRLIDEQILIINNKTMLLNRYKVGLVQKIFIQKIRFRDESGNIYPGWQSLRFSDFLHIGDKHKAVIIKKDRILTVKLHRKGVAASQNTESLSIGSTTYYKRSAGDLIYGKQNLFSGAIDIIPDKLDGYLSSGDVPTLRVDRHKVNSTFLLEYIGRKEYYKKLESLASGSGSKRIHETTLLEQEIILPSIQEQDRIADFLTAVDARIKTAQTKQEQLVKFKLYLLQRMFV